MVKRRLLLLQSLLYDIRQSPFDILQVTDRALRHAGVVWKDGGPSP